MTQILEITNHEKALPKTVVFQPVWPLELYEKQTRSNSHSPLKVSNLQEVP